MNLPQFLKTVDALIKNMSHDQLEVFIHDMARALPEEKRRNFIDRLQAIGNIVESDRTLEQQQHQSRKEFLEQLEEIKEKLTEIDEGRLCLVGELNEEYDDWYHSGDEEFLFEDPKDVLNVINTSVELIHKCVDEEMYKEGYELADILSVVGVEVEGDYCDYAGDPLSLNDLKYYRLLDCDLSQLVRDSVYLAYQGNTLDERPDAIYWMMINLECGSDFTLESVMQNGREELEQFDAFLKLWLEYLGSQKGRGVEKLILEAQSMFHDEEQMVENARKYAGQHPALYEQYLKQHLEKGDYQKLLDIGQEALTAVPVRYTVRSRIALLTSQYALYTQKIAEAEQCWVEAFRSETTPVNFMRVFLESRDYSQYKETLTDIYTSLYERNKKENSYTGGYGELAENRLDDNCYCALLFLDGRFQNVLEIGLNVSRVLGWSGTFIKQGLGLFMLYLFEGDVLPAGLREMCTLAAGKLSFSTEKYCSGLNREVNSEDIPFFWECFRKWKKRNPMPEELRLEIMKKMEYWIEIRVEGIMQANRRNYYRECAAFVAAIGEVKESWGEMAGKERFMQMYRNRYSRRRAFHGEMKLFGLRIK